MGGATALLLGGAAPRSQEASGAAVRRAYDGPNVIVVRFGGGARRRETIEPAHTFSPYLVHELIPRGTLYRNMEIAAGSDVETGHGQGTLRILTGRYDRYEDVDGRFLGERFEPVAPTIFEYLRKHYDIPEHQTLIVNGEDRIDEEFYSFSNHHLFGIRYRSRVLSLYRFKTWLLANQLAEGSFSDGRRSEMEKQLQEMLALDRRAAGQGEPDGELGEFWSRWRTYYGDSGFVNPRGDQLLTELAVRALRELQPRMMMIHYQDCDYVHWGNLSHYTRGVSIMDQGLRRLVEQVEALDAYRGNTVLVVVPDCGRDTNRLLQVPCQHHFGSRSSREIFALFVGPEVPTGKLIERSVDQAQIAATIGAVVGAPTEYAEGAVLDEVLA